MAENIYEEGNDSKKDVPENDIGTDTQIDQPGMTSPIDDMEQNPAAVQVGQTGAAARGAPDAQATQPAATAQPTAQPASVVQTATAAQPVQPAAQPVQTARPASASVTERIDTTVAVDPTVQATAAKPSEQKPGLFDGLSVAQIIAAAAAGATSMALSSTIGFGGSIINAAVSSVITVVCSQVYRHVLDATGEKVKEGIDSIGAGHKDETSSAQATTIMDGSTTNVDASIQGTRVASEELLENANERETGKRSSTQKKVIIFSIILAAIAVVVCAGAIILGTHGEGIGEKTEGIDLTEVIETAEKEEEETETEEKDIEDETSTDSEETESDTQDEDSDTEASSSSDHTSSSSSSADKNSASDSSTSEDADISSSTDAENDAGVDDSSDSDLTVMDSETPDDAGSSEDTAADAEE